MLKNASRRFCWCSKPTHSRMAMNSSKEVSVTEFESAILEFYAAAISRAAFYQFSSEASERRLSPTLKLHV
jgi:hypothetical protein